MKKIDIITIGSATEDIFFYTDEGVFVDNKKDILRQKLLAFEFGAKLKVDKSYALMGGGAVNAAVSFARLGFRVATIAAVGSDIRGKHLMENMKAERIGTAFLQVIKGGTTRFSFVLVGRGNEHIIFTYEGVNSQLVIRHSDAMEMKKTKWIYLASMSGQWKNDLKMIFSVKGPKIAWNPGHIQYQAGIKALKPFLATVDVLTMNKDEAIELVVSDKKYSNSASKFLNNASNLIKVIKGYGPGVVVITLGEKGSFAYDGEKFYRQDIIRAKSNNDTTGVGDAFGSTFVAGLELTGGNIAKALELAARNASSVVSHLGAQQGLMKISAFKKHIR